MMSYIELNETETRRFSTMASAFSVLRLSDVGYIIEGFMLSVSDDMARTDKILLIDVKWSDNAKRRAADAISDGLCGIDQDQLTTDHKSLSSNFHKIGRAIAQGDHVINLEALASTARYDTKTQCYELGM